MIGTPVDPNTYDYRRAAWDAVHFPRLLDRMWQNLRRAAGWNVQYAGCVEPQRRLAPHAHFAIRGTLPRALLEQVSTATYHQVWWPTADRLRYAPDRPPVFDTDAETWVDPDTGAPLPGWADALDAIDDDPDAAPAHVVRFGPQVKAKGVDPGSKDVERTIGYITKYVTKAAAECHDHTSDPQRDHADRLWRELRVTPCSDRCANWLLYGIQPKNATGKLRPGPAIARAASTRRTPSASAGAACSSRATGPARPCATTAPTHTPGSRHCLASATTRRPHFGAWSPDLPGCVALGDSREEALAEMRGAIAFHLEGLREAGEPVPAPTAEAVDLIAA